MPDFFVLNQSPTPNATAVPRAFALSFDVVSTLGAIDYYGTSNSGNGLNLYAAGIQLIDDGYFTSAAFGSVNLSNLNNIHITAQLYSEVSSSHIDIVISAFTFAHETLATGNTWSFDTTPISNLTAPKVINFTPKTGSLISNTPIFNFKLSSQVPIDLGSVFINFNNEIAQNGFYTNPNYSIIHTPDAYYPSLDYYFAPKYTLQDDALVSFQLNCLDAYGGQSEPFIGSFIVNELRPQLLTPTYPTNNQINVPINSTVRFLINPSTSINGLDVSTLNVSINGVSAITAGAFNSNFDGYFSAINAGLTSFDPIEVIIDQTPFGFNPIDIITIIVSIKEPFPFSGNFAQKYSFITQEVNTVQLTAPSTPIFAGYFQGIYYAGSLGDGYHTHLTWHPARSTQNNYDLAYLIYYSTSRSDVYYEGAKLITNGRALPLPETIPGADAQLYGFYTDITMPVGVEYYYGVRATEFPQSLIPVVPVDGYSPFAAGLNVVDGYNFSIPSSSQLLNNLLISGDITIDTTTILGYSTLGGYILIGNEVMRYSSLSITGDNMSFFVMNAGRALFDSAPAAHTIGETISLYLGNVSQSALIAQAVVHWETPGQNDPHRFRPDLITTDFTLEDGYNGDFEPYDYCGWHTPRIDTLLNGGDCGSYMGGNVGGYRNFNIYDQMLAREEMLLEATGEPCVLLKRIWSGEKCPCILSRRESPRLRSCVLCFGTGFKHGYIQYTNPRRQDQKIMLRFNGADEDVKLGSQMGFAQDYKPAAWTLAIPSIKDRDIIIRFDEYGYLDWAYEVLKVGRIKTLFDQWGRQKLSLDRIDKTSVIYQFKATLTTGGMIAPPPQNYLVQKASISATDFQLYDTLQHSVISYTPTFNGNYLITVYYRVLSATNLIITINWSDSSGAQIATPVSGAQDANESYNVTPYYIEAVAGVPIIINAIATIANQVFISSTITQT